MPRYQDTLTTTVSVTASTPTVDKHPYVPKQRIKTDMSEAQKQGVTTWNSLIDKLQEAGLMEEKS